MFRPNRDSYGISVAGFGPVGRAFVRILAEGGAPGSPAFRVVSLCDSSGMVSEAGGIPSARLLELAAAKQAGIPLAAMGAKTAPQRAAPMTVHVELGPTDARTGGPSLGRILHALRDGAAVASSCKGPFVAAWEEISALASASRLPVRFSATVGGGVPLIDLGRSLALGSRITGIAACLNATSSLVLGFMEEGLCLDEAVGRAQEIGLAEADPSADLDGIDASVKLCILSRAVLGRALALDEVERQSVRVLTPERIAAARSRGMRLRAVARLGTGFGEKAQVRLEELQPSSPLIVSGSACALVYETERSGRVAVIGHEVGPRETASAVYRDLLTMAGTSQAGSAAPYLAAGTMT